MKLSSPTFVPGYGGGNRAADVNPRFASTGFTHTDADVMSQVRAYPRKSIVLRAESHLARFFIFQEVALNVRSKEQREY
jgi:hypothetical protein